MHSDVFEYIWCKSLRFYNHYFSFKITFRNYVKLGTVHQTHESFSKTLCCGSYYQISCWVLITHAPQVRSWNNFTAPWWHGTDGTFFLNPFFAFAFALPRFTRVNCKPSARKRNFFHFLRWCLRLRLHLRWCSSHVYLLAFAFAFVFAFASHVWPRLKGALSISNNSLYFRCGTSPWWSSYSEEPCWWVDLQA